MRRFRRFSSQVTSFWRFSLILCSFGGLVGVFARFWVKTLESLLCGGDLGGSRQFCEFLSVTQDIREQLIHQGSFLVCGVALLSNAESAKTFLGAPKHFATLEGPMGAPHLVTWRARSLVSVSGICRPRACVRQSPDHTSLWKRHRVSLHLWRDKPQTNNKTTLKF